MMQTQSYEAQIIARAKAARSACYGRPRIVNLACGRPVAEPEPQRPVEEPTTALGFVKQQCAAQGLTYDQMTSPRAKSDAACAVRKEIVNATAERFPDLGIAKLARLFKRSRATVLHALGRIPGKKASMQEINKRDSRVRVLYQQDYTLAEIATELGLCVTTVKKIRDRNNWPRRGRVKPKGKAG